MIYAKPGDSTSRILFTKTELQCKATGVVRLAEGFEDALRQLRLALDQPMVVTSCCRSTEHNTKIKGAKNSFHIYDGDRGTCAIDIRTPNPDYRIEIVRLALDLHWSVGLANTYVHLDRRVFYGFPQRIFIY